MRCVIRIAAAERDHQALLDRVQLRHAAHRSVKRTLPEGHGEVGRRQQPNIHLELCAPLIPAKASPFGSAEQQRKPASIDVSIPLH